MLPGRGLSKRMFPLSLLETNSDFDLDLALRYGRLPMAEITESEDENIEFLDAYVATYLREEIQQEALVRNLVSFYRFLPLFVGGRTGQRPDAEHQQYRQGCGRCPLHSTGLLQYFGRHLARLVSACLQKQGKS